MKPLLDPELSRFDSPGLAELTLVTDSDFDSGVTLNDMFVYHSENIY